MEAIVRGNLRPKQRRSRAELGSAAATSKLVQTSGCRLVVCQRWCEARCSSSSSRTRSTGRWPLASVERGCWRRPASCRWCATLMSASWSSPPMASSMNWPQMGAYVHILPLSYGLGSPHRSFLSWWGIWNWLAYISCKDNGGLNREVQDDISRSSKLYECRHGSTSGLVHCFCLFLISSWSNKILARDAYIYIFLWYMLIFLESRLV